MRVVNVLGLSVLVGVAGAVAGGCGKDSNRQKYREITGRITSIDMDTGVVSVTFWNKKHRREMTLGGRLAPDAEILVDGVTAQLEDLRVDDRVTVTGREEKHNGSRQMVATRVDVARLEVLPPEAATRPAQATQPVE